MTVQDARKLVVGDQVMIPTVRHTLISGEVKLVTASFLFVVWEDGTRTKFPFDKPLLLMDVEQYLGEFDPSGIHS